MHRGILQWSALVRVPRPFLSNYCGWNGFKDLNLNDAFQSQSSLLTSERSLTLPLRHGHMPHVVVAMYSYDNYCPEDLI